MTANYKKFSAARCFETGQKYQNLHLAKQNCSSDHGCTGILDPDCNKDMDGKHFITCANTIQKVRSNKWCVYGKYDLHGTCLKSRVLLHSHILKTNRILSIVINIPVIVSIFLDFSGDRLCFDVKVVTIQFGSDLEWKLGICETKKVVYDNGKTYLHRCCLKPGQHTLTCTNKRTPYGWGDSYIEILGHRYCDDFMSYRLL